MDFRTDQITLVLEYFSSLAQRFPEQPVGIILRKDLLEMIGKIFCMYTKACFFRIRLNVSVNQDNSLFWFIIMLVYKYYNQQFLFNLLDITSASLYGLKCHRGASRIKTFHCKKKCRDSRYQGWYTSSNILHKYTITYKLHLEGW